MNWTERFKDPGPRPEQPKGKPPALPELQQEWNAKVHAGMVWASASRAYRLAIVAEKMKAGTAGAGDVADAMLVLVIETLEMKSAAAEMQQVAGEVQRRAARKIIH